MGSRNVALQQSTYERLRASRRPGESFTEVVDRLLEGKEPSLLDFVGLISKKDADDLAETIDEMRAEETRVDRRRWGSTTQVQRRRSRGHHV